MSAAQCRRSWDSAGRGSWRWFSSSSSPFTSGLQVLPGYLRARQNWRRASSLAARVSRNPAPGAPLPAPAQQGGARSRLQAMASEVRTPIGRSRQRSRSMTSSPSALLEEYKTRWTCKVPFLIAEASSIYIHFRFASLRRSRCCSSLVVTSVFASRAPRFFLIKCSQVLLKKCSQVVLIKCSQVFHKMPPGCFRKCSQKENCS